MNDLFLYNVQLPLIIIINVFNIFALFLSFIIQYNENKIKKIHKYQKRELLKIYIYSIFWCILFQYSLNYLIFLLYDYIIISKKFSFTNIYQALIIYFFDDLYFYFYHRMLHENKFLYKYIHKMHHRSRSPYPINYIYANPLEIFFGTGGIVISILIQGQLYSFSLILYTSIKTIHEIYIHSGLFIHKDLYYFDIIGSSIDHDIHHYYLKGNYGSNLNYLDKLFDTYITNKYIII